MKRFFYVAVLSVIVSLSACSVTPPVGPDVAPICRDNFINGVTGCYAQ